MTVPKVIDKREAWLDGVSIEAAAVLAKLEKRKYNGITLNEGDETMINLCGGYLYMLELIKKHGLFDSDDPFNLFNKETIH